MPYPLSQKLDSTLRYFNGLYGIAAGILTQIQQAASDGATALANIAAHIGSTGSLPHGAATSSVNGFMTAAQVNTLTTAASNASTALTNAATAQTNAAGAQGAVDALLIRVERAQEIDAVSALREAYRYTGQQLQSFAFAYSGSNVGAMAAVGDGGAIAYGAPGRTLAQQAAGSAYTGVFTDVCTNNAGTWVAVGASGQIQSSVNGTTWTSQKSGGANLNAVAFGQASGAMFVAVGASGDLWYTFNANGSAWIQSTGCPWGTTDLAGVAYVPELGLWFCTTRDGRLYSSTSPNLNNYWILRCTVSGSSPYFSWRSIQYSARFGVVALFGRASGSNAIGFVSSADGITWSSALATTAPGTLSAWQNSDGVRFAILDRSIIVFDFYASPNDAYAIVLQTANIQGAAKFLAVLGKVAIRCAKNVLGQLVVVGQANGGDGVMLMSPLFRPNITSE